MRWRWWKKPEPVLVVVEPSRGVPAEIEEADVQHAYMVGIAQGQIAGRNQLLGEIERRLSARAREPEEYGETDYLTDKHRQGH